MEQKEEEREENKEERSGEKKYFFRVNLDDNNREMR